MWRYTRSGGWTSDDVDEVRDNPDGPWRRVRTDETAADLEGKETRVRRHPARIAAIWWFRLVAIPVTVLCHYLAWLVARPSRTVVVAGVGVVVWLAVRS